MSRVHIRSTLARGEMRRRSHPAASKPPHEFDKTARNGVRSLQESFAGSIRKRPIQAALIALGLGFFYGRFRRSPVEAVLLSAGAGLFGGLILSKSQGAGTSLGRRSSPNEDQPT